MVSYGTFDLTKGIPPICLMTLINSPSSIEILSTYAAIPRFELVPNDLYISLIETGIPCRMPLFTPFNSSMSLILASRRASWNMTSFRAFNSMPMVQHWYIKVRTIYSLENVKWSSAYLIWAIVFSWRIWILRSSGGKGKDFKVLFTSSSLYCQYPWAFATSSSCLHLREGIQIRYQTKASIL